MNLQPLSRADKGIQSPREMLSLKSGNGGTPDSHFILEL